MFHTSHLDQSPVASEHHLPSSMPGMGAADTDPQSPVPSAPAPLAPAAPAPFSLAQVTWKQWAMMGGVALAVFFVLKHVMSKKK
jgi:hypothetical protein